MRVRSLLLVLFALGLTPAAAARTPTVAVLGFDFTGPVPEVGRATLADRLAAGLRLARFAVVPAGEVVRRLGADPLALACRSRACWPRVARAAGAHYLVVAATRMAERTYSITLTLVRGTGTVAAEVRERCELCGLHEAGERMSLAAGALRARLDALAVGPSRLVVRTRPAGAAVELDGVLVGYTPLERDAAAGAHRLAMRRAGYLVEERVVRLTAGVDENVEVELRAAPVAAAASGPPGRGAPRALVYAKTGLVVPASPLDPGFSVQLGGGWVPPILGGRLAALCDLSFGQTGATVAASDPRLGAGGGAAYRGAVTARELRLFVGPQLLLRDPRATVVPFAALGFGLHFVSLTASGAAGAADFGENRQSAISPGLAARGGAGYRLGPGLLAAEVGLSWAPLERQITGGTHLGRVTLLVGYVAALGTAR